jgi:hypothetical protein
MRNFRGRQTDRNRQAIDRIIIKSWSCCIIIVLLLLTFSGCGRKAVESTRAVDEVTLSDQQACSLNTKTIFFGHQSVGDNIMQGVRDLMARDQRLKLNIVDSDSPETVSGPAFIESHIGENQKPQSKDKAFRTIMEKGIGLKGGIAMYKYCYVDIDSSTVVRQMFENYREGIAGLKQLYPMLKIVHITVPLTTVESKTKAWAKAILGKPTSRDANIKRNHFNNLLRQTYGNTDPIYDLAEAESTRPDGTRSFFMQGSERIFVLAPELTTDGGHLNEAGSRAAAQRLLLLLSKI